MIEAGFSAGEGPLAAVGFRDIAESDLPFLCQLYGSTRAAELAPVPWTDAQKAQFIQMQFDAQHAHYQQYFPQAAFLLLSCDSTPIGRLYIDRREEDIRLIDIALLPEHRNQGLGSALLRQLIDEARQTGRALSIHVEKNNPAMALYQRLGFEKTEDQGVYDLMVWTASESELS